MNKQFIITNFAAFALMLFLPTGCRQADGKQDAVQSYRVIKVAASPVEISESYSAAIRGRQDVDILPQISGRIIRLKVKEGERVKTGQVLAVIDQVPYRAALRTAQANVSAAQAKVETARIELRGKQALFDEKVISDYELSLARNQLAVACAELEQAKAQESDARNNLSYTEIKSPSNGVVGTLPYRIGALVGPNMAQPFTVVSDNAEMYAYFSISENMLRRYLARYGSIDSMIAGMPEVGLQLNDGSLYKAKGRIETVSGVVDPVTGTVQIKALFPNPDRELLSGSIGNVILQNPKTEAVTIPMTATVELQDKIIAYRLKNGQAEAAYLTVDRLNDGNRFIENLGNQNFAGIWVDDVRRIACPVDLDLLRRLTVDMHSSAALLLILLDVVAELRVHKWFFFGETAFFKILCPKELLIHSVPKKLFADMLEIGHPL